MLTYSNSKDHQTAQHTLISSQSETKFTKVGTIILMLQDKNLSIDTTDSTELLLVHVMLVKSYSKGTKLLITLKTPIHALQF